jgi:DnaK suppressor protein
VPYLGLPSGQRQLMIGEPVASASDLQRYKELLLDKQRELSSIQGDVETRVPASGGLEGDLIDQANADAEAELQIRLHQTDARLLRAIEEALGRIRQGTFGVCQRCKQPISEARLEAVPWTMQSAQVLRRLTPAMLVLNHRRKSAITPGLFALSLARRPFPQTVNSLQAVLGRP